MIPQTSAKPRISTTAPSLDITSADRAYRHLGELAASEIEEFWALALGPKKGLLRSKMIFRGTVDSCLVHPRDIFRFACLENASSILIAHNHPSGDLHPSYEDIRFTQQIVSAATLMEIPVIDHIIVTSTGYSSLRSEGWCQFQQERSVSPSGLKDHSSSYESCVEPDDGA